MFIRVYDKAGEPGRVCWDNDMLYYDGQYFAMFNFLALDGKGYSVDLHSSPDGVHWTRLLKDALPIEGAHAGYSFHQFGDRFYYHATCTTPERGIHFKTYASKDLLNWTHMGDEFDVLPNPEWYAQRWDELQVLDDSDENGEPVYYGYISAEVRPEIGAPSCGLLKSRDGLRWEALPPPVIEWGHIPAHHMEVQFCEKLHGRYYLCLSGRLYMNNMGYSLYTYVSDSPEGPFKPDVETYRLHGTSNCDVTWLSHTFATPDGLLAATWLSHDESPEIPSGSFAIAPLKRAVAPDGHLRLAYWSGNDAVKGCALALPEPMLVHPLPSVRRDDEGLKCEGDALVMRAGRDGLISEIAAGLDREAGWILEGRLLLRENRTAIETHHHAAFFGIALFDGARSATIMAASTQGSCLSGPLSFDDHAIGTFGLLDDARAAQGLHQARSGPLRGLLQFECRDALCAIGYASAPTLRHGRECSFRVIARGDYFELYINDLYVQTFLVPDHFDGRIGFLVLDGDAHLSQCRAWMMDA